MYYLPLMTTFLITVCFSLSIKESEANKTFNLTKLFCWAKKVAKTDLPPFSMIFKLYPYIILHKKEQKVSSQ